jgi:hypothetical protein
VFVTPDPPVADPDGLRTRLTRTAVGYSGPMTPAVTAIVRVGTWTLIGTLAALGLISVGAALVVPAGVAAGIGAVVGWAVAGQRTPSLVAAAAAAACGTAVLAIAGLAVLAGPATFFVAPAVVLPLVLTRRKRGVVQAQAQAPAPSTLSNLSNAQLAREWHTSYTALAAARDPGSLERICALRKCQLDEIERRAPGGLQRWVESGAWVRGDSAPFLGG